MSNARIQTFGVIQEDEQGRILLTNFAIDLNNEFIFPYGKEIGMLKLVIERLQSELNTCIIHSTRDSFSTNKTEPSPETMGSNIVLFNKGKDPNE